MNQPKRDYNCDCAGIIEPDLELARFMLGASEGLGRSYLAPQDKEKEKDQEKEKEEKPKSSASAPSLPFGELFAESWRQWEKHRREIKKPLQPTQIAKQLAKLSAMTESDAVEMIDHTIEKGWQGLREPDKSTPTHRAEKQSKEFPEALFIRHL